MECFDDQLVMFEIEDNSSLLKSVLFNLNPHFVSALVITAIQSRFLEIGGRSCVGLW